MEDFTINFLDHVAIRVTDLKTSEIWYESVLGLKRYQLPEWGSFPLFMLSGKTGVALFPANEDDPILEPSSRNVKIDHFAFNVTHENLQRAKNKYEELGLSYSFEDHHYFHSLYTKDPDGHTVELTALVVPEESFYRDSK